MLLLAALGNAELKDAKEEGDVETGFSAIATTLLS
jgi:hypothetical protein